MYYTYRFYKRRNTIVEVFIIVTICLIWTVAIGLAIIPVKDENDR